MSKALESGKSFLAGVLAKLPETLRGQVETAFNAPEAADALTVIGTGALAQPEINRRLDEIRGKETELDQAILQAQTDYTRNKEWWDKTSTEYERLKGLETKPPVTPPVTPPSTGMSKEDLEALLNQRDEGYASVLGLATTLATKHYKDFGEVLDGNDLIAFAKKNRIPLADAYQQKFAEQIKAKHDKEEADRIDKLVQEKLMAERKTLSQPYPLRQQEASALDVLEQKDKPALPDPAEFYNQLTQARG